MQRRYLVSGGLWLCAIAAGALRLNKPLAIVLFALGALSALLGSEAVASRLPTLTVQRGDGLTLCLRPPQRRGRRRLRQEALALASEIHAYVRTVDAPWSAERDDWSQNTQAMSAAETEEERTRLWNEYTARSTERSAREAQDLAARFGGRLHFVTREFQRRGLLTDQEMHKIDWEANSLHWIVSAANEIEGLARRL